LLRKGRKMSFKLLTKKWIVLVHTNKSKQKLEKGCLEEPIMNKKKVFQSFIVIEYIDFHGFIQGRKKKKRKEKQTAKNTGQITMKTSISTIKQNKMKENKSKMKFVCLNKKKKYDVCNMKTANKQIRTICLIDLMMDVFRQQQQ
ncbi:hypothetical protein RFI_00694, partial [Reticulomyxa filosa]